jgi:hypothetical protein
MSKDEGAADGEAYSTHLNDQLGAAQAEQEEKFAQRAEEYGIGEPIMVSDEVFEDSYFSEIIPWLKDLFLREKLKGCKHIDSPQPLWVFFNTENFVHCEGCAETVQLYRSLSTPEEDSPCDICFSTAELSWVFASYQYFTLSGLICQPCSEKHSTSIGHPPGD